MLELLPFFETPCISLLCSRWVAKWLRRKRGLLCSPDSYIQFGGVIPACRQHIRALREARCQNYDTGLLETLQTKLDCLSYNQGVVVMTTVTRIMVGVIGARLL